MEEERAKVRVVRCPKCDKLLPELANFSVYRCGGCNATLQAKKQVPTSEASSEKSNGEVVKYLENAESSSENKGVVVSNASSEVDQKVVRVDFRKEEKKFNLNESPDSDSSLMATSEYRDALKEPDSSRLDLPMESGTESRISKYRRSSKAPLDVPATDVDNSVESKVEEQEAKMPFDRTTEFPKFQPRQARRDEDRERSSAFHLPVPCPDEGPSNYHSNTSKERNLDNANSAEFPDHDRAELLRKLDELSDQLRRSCEVAEKPKERASVNRTPFTSNPHGRTGRGNWFPEGASSFNRISSRHSPYMNGHNTEIPNLYPAVHPPNGIPAYSEVFAPHSLGRAPFHPPGQYPQRPMNNNYLYGQFDPDPLISYHHDGFYHQPACSCLHCYNSHWPTIYGNQRAQYPVNNHGFYPVDGPSAFGPQSYNRREQNVPMHSHELRAARQRAMIAKKDGPSCGPVAGAAPFIACYYCSEFLQLPADFSWTCKSKHKLRCGSCSQLISFEFDGRRLIPAPTANITSENVNDCKDDTSGNMNGHPVNSYSGDFDSPGYEVHSADEKLVLPSFPVSSNEMIEKEYGLHLSESEKMQEISSSPSISEDVDSLDSLICQRDVPSSTEFPLETEGISCISSLPLREHFVYSLSNQVVDGPGNGSRSRRSVQEKVLSVNGIFKQNYVKEIPVATEMDLPDDECSDADLSQDPWEVSNDENQPRVKNSKTGESFFVGLIKKSFIKDFSKSNQSIESGRCKVSVNGHPISDRLVKKAEKLAGPVHPGDYWYDYRAGFWGAMGHACLGIIPPFIEEFNYPMPKNCAGGNTGVLVNGRELHQRDLSLLASRGLPATEGHSYIIEICGKVWDETSGEELDSLGKLAPTIEKVKHGFGMRVPRLIA